MNLLFSKLDAASADPRSKWKQVVANIIEIRMRGIESDVAASILLELVAAVDGKLADVFERAAFFEADRVLGDFDNAVTTAASDHYAKQREADGDGIDKLVTVLSEKGWSGRILGHLRTMMRKGERLESVEYFAIVTNQRRLERAAIKAYGRTVAETNDRFFDRQFLSDEAVRQLEADATEEAERRARPPTYGRNLDLGAAGVRR